MAKKNANNTNQTLNGLTTNQLIALKKLLAQVNNAVSLQLTLKFIEQLRADGIISFQQAARISNTIRRTNINANGFDVDYTGNVNNTPKSGILAEVKGCYPVHVNAYGSAQLKAITKDIACLDGSSSAVKVQQLAGGVGRYYRFMVLLDDGSCQAAIASILELPSAVPLALYNPHNLDRKHIYIVPVRI